MPSLTLLNDAGSARRKDENGFLHVADNPVSRVQVAPYYGYEIPDWQKYRLDPDRQYHFLRPADELEAMVPSIKNLPIELDHHETDAENLPKAAVIGSMGSDARFDGEFLRVSLCFTDADAIRAIESGEIRELSMSYFFDLDMTPGSHEGQPYDGVMRNLRGNHLALVTSGRCGPRVGVRDAASPQPLETDMDKKTIALPAGLVGRLLKMLGRRKTAQDADPAEIEARESELIEELKEVQALELAQQAAGEDETPPPPPATDDDPDGPDALVAAVMELAKQAQLDDDVMEKLAELLAKLKESARPDDQPALDGKGGCDGDPAPAPTPQDVKKAAQDSARAVVENMQALMDACEAVRPVLGNIRPNVARDSAADVYKQALQKMGISCAGIPSSAYAHMYKAASSQMRPGMIPAVAQDTMPEDARAQLSGLDRVRG